MEGPANTTMGAFYEWEQGGGSGLTAHQVRLSGKPRLSGSGRGRAGFLTWTTRRWPVGGGFAVGGKRNGEGKRGVWGRGGRRGGEWGGEGGGGGGGLGGRTHGCRLCCRPSTCENTLVARSAVSPLEGTQRCCKNGGTVNRLRQATVGAVSSSDPSARCGRISPSCDGERTVRHFFVVAVLP